MIEHKDVTVTHSPLRTIETQQVTVSYETHDDTFQLEVHKTEGDDNWQYVAFLILEDGTTEDCDENTTNWIHSIAWQKDNISPNEGQMELWDDDIPF